MSYVIDKVSADGVEMEYVRFGQGKKTLVILPGLSVQSVIPSAPAIEKQYEIFSRDFTVYLFDRNKTLPPVYTVIDMAEDTAKAMKALGLSGACLFGASQGGMIAMALTIYHPELVSRLSVGSSACAVEKSAVLDEWKALARKGDSKELYLSFGKAVYPKEIFEQYREALIRMSGTVSDAELRRFAALAEGTDSFDIRDKMGRIQCPVLVIGDTEDAVLGASASAEIAERLNDNPDAELFMYRGYGHAAYDTAPDYAERLYRFFM